MGLWESGVSIKGFGLVCVPSGRHNRVYSNFSVIKLCMSLLSNCVTHN